MGSANCFGGGVDQMPTFANTLYAAGSMVREALTDAVNNHRFAIIVRVGDVNDLVNDPGVAVQVFRAYPTFSTGCVGVQPGREYSIATTSLLPDSVDFRAGAQFSRAGSIVGGHLVVPLVPGVAQPWTVPLTGASSPIVMPLRAAQVRVDISTSEITRGAIGGYSLGADVIDAVIARGAQSDLRPVMEQVMGEMVDIEVNGVCDTGPAPDGGTRRFGGLSFGFEIHGIPARVSTTQPLATAQRAGTCGS